MRGGPSRGINRAVPLRLWFPTGTTRLDLAVYRLLEFLKTDRASKNPPVYKEGRRRLDVGILRLGDVSDHYVTASLRVHAVRKSAGVEPDLHCSPFERGARNVLSALEQEVVILPEPCLPPCAD